VEEVSLVNNPSSMSIVERVIIQPKLGLIELLSQCLDKMMVT
jgi:hypothetical protein